MPTPAGKPQKGDRVRLKDGRGKFREGVVLARSSGEYYSIIVQWDGEKSPRSMVDAPWWIKQGQLEVFPPGDTLIDTKIVAVLDVLAPRMVPGGPRYPIFEWGQEETPTMAQMISLAKEIIEAINKAS